MMEADLQTRPVLPVYGYQQQQQQQHHHPGETADTLLKQPQAPNPAADVGILPVVAAAPVSASSNPPSPPVSETWDAGSLPAGTALKMLGRSLQQLANATPDIPPTPPISRSHTLAPAPAPDHSRRKSQSRSATPTHSLPHLDVTASAASMPEPEAELSEPVLAVLPSFGGGGGATTVITSAADGPADGNATEHIHQHESPLQHRHQQEMIARKFYSRRPPPISLEDYLLRLQRYCPMSTAVYLAAAAYIQKVALEERAVPITSRTVHRLVLGSLRVAMKALEDLRYSHSRFAGVGGVDDSELSKLEISVCYLTDFDLQVNNQILYERVQSLRLAAQQAADRASAPLLAFSSLPVPLTNRTNG